MEPKEPFNLWTMEPNAFIQRNMIKEVTSSLVFEPSTNQFHPEGLYSETIFGQIGTAKRVSTLGYINLYTNILAPVIYKNVIDIKPIYNSIMQGKTFATWDNTNKCFQVCSKETEGADTGFAYFISHFNDVKFEYTSSPARNNKIDIINKARSNNTAIVDKLIVSPAGLRDVKQEKGHIQTEEVNTLYSSIISISRELQSSLTNPFLAKFYDGVKYNIQLKVYQVYAYWENFLNGKTGFAQRKYARRAIAYGTRNVVTSAEMTGYSPNDSSYLKHDETLVPTYQGAKAFQPLIIYYMKLYFFSNLIQQGQTRLPAIDPETKKFSYIDLSDADITKYTSNEYVEEVIKEFQNPEMRLNPVTVKDINGKDYWLMLVCDLGDRIYLLKNIDEFLSRYSRNISSKTNESVDESKIRPLTYLEMMYISVFLATMDKYVTITRYPAIELGSIYPSKVKIGSTVPSREVTYCFLHDVPSLNVNKLVMPHYPILGNAYLDSTVFHPTQAEGLGA